MTIVLHGFESRSNVVRQTVFFHRSIGLSKHPGIRLNRLTLTLLILGAILIPVGSALGLFFLSKPIPEPQLMARVRLDGMWVEDRKNPGQKKLVPAISVRNPTSKSWGQLTVGLNKSGRNNQFYASEPTGIPAGKTVSIPLFAFVARNGSVTFPAGNRNVKEVTVFAKLPNNARGVAEFILPQTPTVPKSDEDQESSWIEPLTRQ
jgi:hypothetical protein